MSSKEPDARIRIDKMLLEAGWKLPGWAKDEEINVTTEINNNSGEADYVLLSSKENHLCTVEAKKTLLSPLVGKEQARGYAKSLNCRFIILSNGILHYLWDLEQGNPVKIEKFPSQEDLEMKTTFNPPRDEDEDNGINEDYLALTQFPQYKDSPDFKNEETSDELDAEELSSVAGGFGGISAKNFRTSPRKTMIAKMDRVMNAKIQGKKLLDSGISQICWPATAW